MDPRGLGVLRGLGSWGMGGGTGEIDGAFLYCWV